MATRTVFLRFQRYLTFSVYCTDKFPGETYVDIGCFSLQSGEAHRAPVKDIRGFELFTSRTESHDKLYAQPNFRSFEQGFLQGPPARKFKILDGTTFCFYLLLVKFPKRCNFGTISHVDNRTLVSNFSSQPLRSIIAVGSRSCTVLSRSGSRDCLSICMLYGHDDRYGDAKPTVGQGQAYCDSFSHFT